MKIHLPILLFLFCVGNFSVFSQDIHFSQYNLTPLAINPALAGAYKNFEAIANYKSQWTSLSPNAYKTIMVSCDSRMMQSKWKSKWLTAGLNVFKEKAGDGNMSTLQSNLSFGFHTMLSDKHTLGGALLVGFAQRGIDYAPLSWNDQYQNGSYDKTNPSGETSLSSTGKFSYPDVGFGILHQFSKGLDYSTTNDMILIRTGLAVTHLNKPSYTFAGSNERLYARIIGHIDAVIGIPNTNFAILPGFLYMRQGPSSEIIPGSYFRYVFRKDSKFTGIAKSASIAVGTHLRLKDSFIPSVQLELSEYTIGISYDVNISSLKSVSYGKGGFEISLRYNSPNTFAFKSSASFK